VDTSQADPLDTTPLYNVKAVATLLGISAVTLRAWERRYGLPTPRRSEHGYRLYSEYDIRTLHWLKSQTEVGVAISRAALHLGQLRAAGRDPAEPGNLPAEAPASLPNLEAHFYQALADMDESRAAESLRLAFALYTFDQVLLEVIRPALVRLGEGWHRGEVPIAVEHFASQFCLRQLMTLMSAAGPASRRGLLVAGCAPGEQHEIGLLMLVAMLRWRGWEVMYLGPNLSLERLAEALAPLRPSLLLLSASRPETANALKPLERALARFPEPRPEVVLGGQGFASGGEAQPPIGVFVDGPPTEVVRRIEGLLGERGD
jgi:DNA-binding transcriptional MerR regulator